MYADFNVAVISGIDLPSTCTDPVALQSHKAIRLHRHRLIELRRERHLDVECVPFSKSVTRIALVEATFRLRSYSR